MAVSKELNYKAIGAVIAISAIVFTAIGVVYVGPMLEKRKAKKLAITKKNQILKKA
ncbi:hypothetical protein HN014_10685 [Aquimarina sp. TRL1]|uniref:hypothetical protein n=1 Tax=Aquimarina sp. (strain TRL1) TaxID=2736252 RepID=UPI0015893C00|nr:hypothetical protein [Aquimarina sp. TRL1]QKX05361.1 hypothetical protein HN014_10685 [Aquimarina sp. TRL1]